MSEAKIINVGRKHSGGVFDGLFGNPVREETVSEQYRTHIQKILKNNPKRRQWLLDRIKEGYLLYCPGCGIDSPTCHTRILKEELQPYQ